jgi:hypothetical protein
MNINSNRTSMIEKAASRVRIAHLAKQRALKEYRLHMKNVNVSDIKDDLVHIALHNQKELTRANWEEAVLTYEAVQQSPPISG